MGQFALPEDSLINRYKGFCPTSNTSFLCRDGRNTSERQNGRDLLDGVRAIIESEDKN
jgi:hypothetical protein